jgi:hypothetical protein
MLLQPSLIQYGLRLIIVVVQVICCPWNNLGRHFKWKITLPSESSKVSGLMEESHCH